MLSEQHKSEIEQLIKTLGGPYSTIEYILKQTGPLSSKQKRALPFIIECLDYIVNIRHVSFGAINNIVMPYNLHYLDNKFNLSV
jgi:hypothetical protein